MGCLYYQFTLCDKNAAHFVTESVYKQTLYALRAAVESGAGTKSGSCLFKYAAGATHVTHPARITSLALAPGRHPQNVFPRFPDLLTFDTNSYNFHLTDKFKQAVAEAETAEAAVFTAYGRPRT
jgi:hypothetical protein